MDPGVLFGIFGFILGVMGIFLGFYAAKKESEILKNLKGKDLENYLKYRTENPKDKLKILLIVFGLIIAITSILLSTGINQILLTALGIGIIILGVSVNKE